MKGWKMTSSCDGLETADRSIFHCIGNNAGVMDKDSDGEDWKDMMPFDAVN